MQDLKASAEKLLAEAEYAEQIARAQRIIRSANYTRTSPLISGALLRKSKMRL